MAILLLAELKPGLRLSRGVLSPQGALLAQPGDELTEKQIRLFKMWGVSEAEVMEVESTDSVDHGSIGEISDDPLDIIDELFDKHLDDHVMYQIAAIAKQLVAKRTR